MYTPQNAAEKWSARACELMIACIHKNAVVQVVGCLSVQEAASCRVNGLLVSPESLLQSGQQVFCGACGTPSRRPQFLFQHLGQQRL